MLFLRTFFSTTPEQETAFAALVTGAAAPVGVGAAVPHLQVQSQGAGFENLENFKYLLRRVLTI